MKVALVSTPRSGNTWLRYMLASLYEWEQHAVHTPPSLDWEKLPEGCIVQMHWHRTSDFTSLLARCGFRALTIARHPLAVLLSIWQFAPHEPQTANWLEGEGGNEDTILKAAVASPEFLAYACSDRARALLSVTPEWWDAPGVARVRYEDLVDHPQRTLTGLCEALGPPRRSIAETLEAHTLDKLKPTAGNSHFWQGRTDAWREMIPHEFALEIAHVHREVFERMGYAAVSGIEGN